MKGEEGAGGSCFAAFLLFFCLLLPQQAGTAIYSPPARGPTRHWGPALLLWPLKKGFIFLGGFLLAEPGQMHQNPARCSPVFLAQSVSLQTSPRAGFRHAGTRGQSTRESRALPQTPWGGSPDPTGGGEAEAVPSGPRGGHEPSQTLLSATFIILQPVPAPSSSLAAQIPFSLPPRPVPAP